MYCIFELDKIMWLLSTYTVNTFVSFTSLQELSKGLWQSDLLIYCQGNIFHTFFGVGHNIMALKRKSNKWLFCQDEIPNTDMKLISKWGDNFLNIVYPLKVSKSS